MPLPPRWGGRARAEMMALLHRSIGRCQTGNDCALQTASVWSTVIVPLSARLIFSRALISRLYGEGRRGCGQQQDSRREDRLEPVTHVHWCLLRYGVRHTFFHSKSRLESARGKNHDGRGASGALSPLSARSETECTEETSFRLSPFIGCSLLTTHPNVKDSPRCRRDGNWRTTQPPVKTRGFETVSVERRQRWRNSTCRGRSAAVRRVAPCVGSDYR